MTRNLLPYLFLLVSALATNFFAQRVWAQGSGSGTMTAEDATAIKAIKIANLEKDTYFKAGGYILDRYEERPAYVFNYSDGIQRKVYLYRVYAASDTKELGLLALYQNGKTGEIKPFVIPGANADRKAWDAYIDDLKYVGEKESGLMSALSFVLSREMSNLLLGGTGAKADDKKKEDNNFCFAPDAPVALPDGGTKPISEVKPGDVVLGYDAITHTLVPTRVTGVQAHTPTTPTSSISLMSLWLAPAHELTATRPNRGSVITPLTLFEATPTHPVLTSMGRKSLWQVQVNEQLYRVENGQLVAYRVVRRDDVGRPVPVVYTITTERGAFVVDGVVVLDK